ncbi:MAG: FtsX-like permease family protein [Clostridia bacterium]|nr:FtsX-like permease family protein [Clostridia bacterium]
MYLRILKKDLKRKRIMNAILLVFIILATTFVSSSVNNMVTVVTAMDDFFDAAGMSDYFVVTKTIGMQSEKSLEDIIRKEDCVDSYTVEPILFVGDKEFGYENTEYTVGSAELSPFEKSAINYFDADNNRITKVKEGEIYFPQKTLAKNDFKVGDTVNITLGDTTLKLTIKGFVKDALLGSSFMGLSRFLIAEKDFNKLYNEEDALYMKGELYSIETQETQKVSNLVIDSNIPTAFLGSISDIENCYILDMVIAGLLFVVSLCLVLIALAVLRFTINFTLSEEFREIGVMKAIGIKNGQIKGLYLVKYFALSVVGAAIGFIISIPFGSMLLENAAKTMMIKQKNPYFVNLICVAAVVGIVILFCYRCAAKVNKFTPVDAVRNGSNGERYKAKSVISLSKSKMRPILFMSLNDIASNLKRYAIMVLTFTLGLLIIIMVVNSVNTLKSDKLVSWFCMKPSDVYMVNDSKAMNYLVPGGREIAQADLKEIEEILAENDMDANCSIEIAFKQTLAFGDNKYSALIVQGTGTKVEDYIYTEGSAPQNKNEIAITSLVAEKLDASIGDTVTMSSGDEKIEYLITAKFQSMNNMGDGVRLHDDAVIDYANAIGMMAYQITFDDSPEREEVADRIEKLKEILPDYKFYTGGEYVNYMIGAAGAVESLIAFVLPVLILICMLVAMLMERSFIAKEKGEIAMLKAIGFSNGSIIGWHTLRMAVVLFISIAIGALISTPVTQLCIGPVFKMMGADYIEFDIKALEVFVIYPLILMAATLIAVFIAAGNTRKISASDTSNIE